MSAPGAARFRRFIDLIDSNSIHARSRNIIGRVVKSVEGGKGTFTLDDDKKYVNFGSCSYMCLEFDPRVQAASAEAAQRFGSSISSAITYVRCELYDELKEKLDTVLDADVMLTPTTTLGHMQIIPTLVGPKDIVLVDQQAHSSMQHTTHILRAHGIPVQTVPHSDMQALEDALRSHHDKHDKVWYLGDGVYSMFGDKAPMDDLQSLMQQYSGLQVYLDDSHSFGVIGARGEGYVTSEVTNHPQLITISSFCKSMATLGAVAAFSKGSEMHRRASQLGNILTGSGPLLPACLGTAIACTDIYLSGEMADMQADLSSKIAFANAMLARAQLPCVMNDVPVNFVAIGSTEAAYLVVERMVAQGFWVNIAAFPVVPMKSAGIRFTINRLLSYDQIEAMITALQETYYSTLAELGLNRDELLADFDYVEFRNWQETPPAALSEAVRQEDVARHL